MARRVWCYVITRHELARASEAMQALWPERKMGSKPLSAGDGSGGKLIDRGTSISRNRGHGTDCRGPIEAKGRNRWCCGKVWLGRLE